MTCNCQGYCSCGCESEQPINVIEQAVNDALAGRIDELNGYSESAKDSADAAKVSETNAEGYAEDTKGYRDQTEIIYQDAQALVPAILEASQNVEDAANAVENAIEIASSVAVVRYPYTVIGGETTIVVPSQYAARSVQSIDVEGYRQYPGYGYTYDAASQTVTMDEAFDAEQAGTVVMLLLGTLNADSPETIYSNLASASGATLIGTSGNVTVQEVLDTLAATEATQETSIAELQELYLNTGFNKIGQCPSVAVLRTIEPTEAGQRITLRAYAEGTGYGGGQLRAVLDGSTYTDNGVTVFKTTGGAAWIRVNADIITSFMAGAIPDAGTTDNTAAINRFLLAGKKLVMGDGTFGHAGQISLQSGITLDLSGATIKPASTLLTAAWVGSGLSDVKIFAGILQGTGLDNTTGNGQLMTLTNCIRCVIEATTFTQAPNDGLRFVSCSYCIASNVISYYNLSVGIQDRDGTYNTIIGCKCNNNGATASVTGTGGRGILTWRSFGSKIVACDAFNNTEYGIRAYSQTGDSRGSTQILISDCHAGDNTKIDIYVYNEIGSLAEILVSNPMIRRTTQPEGALIALQGTRVSCNGGSLVKSGDRLTVPCISLYNTDSAAVRDITVGNVGQFLAQSGASNSLIANCVVNCSTVGIGGEGTTYQGNKFIHGGTGTTDIAIDASASINYIMGNTFAGFYRDVSWNSQAMTIVNNVSTGTTDVSLRMFGDAIQLLTHAGNKWDAVSNPTIVATVRREGSNTSKAVAYAGAAPTTLTWSIGDRVINNAPAVGSPKGWVCTVSGTPGTWVSEGNL